MNTPRYQHISFGKLKIGEDFFTRKFRYTKTGYLTGRAILDGHHVRTAPWRKVRSARPFGKVRPPQKVEGGDRTPETIGGNELTPSA